MKSFILVLLALLFAGCVPMNHPPRARNFDTFPIKFENPKFYGNSTIWRK